MSLTAHSHIKWYLPEQEPEPTRLEENDCIVLLCIDHNIVVTGEYLKDEESGCEGQWHPHGNVSGDVTHWTWFEKGDWPSLDIYQKDQK